MDNRGLNLVDRLLWACVIVVTGAEGYKVHVPWGGEELTYVGSSNLIFLARITKLGIMVYLDESINTSCVEVAGAHCTLKAQVTL